MYIRSCPRNVAMQQTDDQQIFSMQDIISNYLANIFPKYCKIQIPKLQYTDRPVRYASCPRPRRWTRPWPPTLSYEPASRVMSLRVVETSSCEARVVPAALKITSLTQTIQIFAKCSFQIFATTLSKVLQDIESKYLQDLPSKYLQDILTKCLQDILPRFTGLAGHACDVSKRPTGRRAGWR